MAYAVVGGHNAIVPGASGCGYAEHAVARQMVAKVLEYMKAAGETAYDCTDNSGRTAEDCWKNAARNCNNAIGGNGLAISIHLNAASGTATGTEVLHYNSSSLAAKVSSNIAAVLGVRDRGPKDGKSIGFINSTKAEAILIELCFIDNSSDMQKLMSKFDEVAKAIVEAVTGKTVGGSTMQNQNVITSGAFSPHEVPIAMQALNSVKMTATFYLKSDGLTYFVSDPTSDAQADGMKGWLDRKGWWYQVE